MAAISSNGTGGGNWSAGSSWVGGVAPVAGDDVTIVSGDVITLTGAAASATCVVDAGGTLAIAGQTLTLTGAITVNGHATGGAGGKLVIGANSSGSAGTMEFQGASGNRFVLEASGAYEFVLCPGQHKWIQLKALQRVYLGPYTPGTIWGQDHYVEDVLCTDLRQYGFYANQNASEALMIIRRATFEEPTIGLSTYAARTRFEARMEFWDCDFSGVTPSGDVYCDDGTQVEAHNCIFGAVPFAYDKGAAVMRCTSFDGVEGDWRIYYRGGYVFRSAAAKNAGSFGVEMVPNAACDKARNVYFDIDIPVESGDVVTPSLTYKNATADLDLEAASGRLLMICDPGNEWGLHEIIDVSGGADSFNVWRTKTFAGGAVGGTGAKGLLKIRVCLGRYVSTGVVYVADPAV